MATRWHRTYPHRPRDAGGPDADIGVSWAPSAADGNQPHTPWRPRDEGVSGPSPLIGLRCGHSPADPAWPNREPLGGGLPETPTRIRQSCNIHPAVVA